MPEAVSPASARSSYRRRAARRGRAAAAIGCAVLTGCGLLNGEPQPPCPRVLRLADAVQVTLFRPGPGRDLTDVRFEGEITGLAATCEYDSDGYVDVDLAIAMTLTRGPAAEGNVGRYEYFVAITGPDGAIAAKQVFPLEAEFPAAAHRVTVREEVSQRIFFRPQPDATGYRTFVGFQLTREQLDYARGR